MGDDEDEKGHSDEDRDDVEEPLEDVTQQPHGSLIK